MKHRGQGLVDQEGKGRVNGALEQGEGHIEDEQGLHQAVGARAQHLVGGNDLIQAAEHLGIHRVADVVVDRHADHSHGHGAQGRRQDGPLAGLFLFIDQAGNPHKNCPQQEVTQLADAAGAAVEQQVEYILDQADQDAIRRAQAEGSQQGRQLGHIHLHKAGDDGQAEIQKHQQGRHGGEHGRHSEFAGFGLILTHDTFPPGPRCFKSQGPLFAEHRSRAGGEKAPASKNALLRLTQKGTANTGFRCCFFHPDYTVGPGISPGQPPPNSEGSWALPPVGTFTPP